MVEETIGFLLDLFNQTFGGNCNFGLQTVYPKGISNNKTIYDGRTDGGNTSHNPEAKMRPLLTIPLSSCTLKASSTPGIDFDISPK